MIRFLAIAACLALAAPAGAQDTKVYAVLVLDTDADARLSKATNADREIVTGFLKGGLGPAALTISELNGNKVTLADLRAHVNGLGLRKGVDTLVCYIACHGGVDTNKNNSHFFQFNGGGKTHEVYRDEVRQVLTGAEARLTVLLSDSCSNPVALGPKPGKLPDIGVLSPKKGLPKRLLLAPAKVRALPGFGALFLDASGVIDINASSTGDFAWFSPSYGGFFTLALNDAFVAMADEKDINWTTFYRNLKLKTRGVYTTWREAAIKEHGPHFNEMGKNEQEDYLRLEKQEFQLTQARFLDGTRVRMVVENAEEGVRVEELPLNSPALAAGLRLGDVIVAINGQKVGNAKDYMSIGGKVLAASPNANAELKVTYRRNGQQDTVTVIVPPLKK